MATEALLPMEATPPMTLKKAFEDVTEPLP